MFADQGSKTDKPSLARAPKTDASEQGAGLVQPPTLSLPKGGGAIKGIGEKFAANPVTGTGSMTVPIATSPGRSGFGPQLALAYDSGAGNGPFGLGWSLSLPAITRKTDKGLPQYRDGEESDVFILSGAEDLVPAFKQDAAGHWIRDAKGNPIIDDNDQDGYTVRRYRPRSEGLFARIERWTHKANGDVYWRSISKDNITTLYGKREAARIADPAVPLHIFSWLICESYDDKGNAILYAYKPEDDKNVDRAAPQEQNRLLPTAKFTQRYLKRIQYGNTTPRLPGEDLTLRTDWLFDVVFDYGEHDISAPTTKEAQVWPVRQDPFSLYRATFEIRTYRLCCRVLVFHHFTAELGTADYLVRSTDFEYTESPIATFITAVTQRGYVRQPDGSYLPKALPPLAFQYTAARVDETVHTIDAASIENLPYGLDGTHYQWVDLDSEGLSGVLTEQAAGWFYKRNLGNGILGPVELVASRPSLALLNGGQQQMLDLAGDGLLDLVQFAAPVPGFYERTTAGGWDDFTPFQSLPNLAWHDPNLRFVDLTGNGHADILIAEDAVFTWYPSLAEAGFGPAERTLQAWDEEKGPKLIFADPVQSIFLADMSGDGLTDLVRIRNAEVCYWPNLGYGRFGAKVTMSNSPRFDYADNFDPKRIRVADIDGSGATDIIYLGHDEIRFYFNQSGNMWSDPQHLTRFPKIGNLTAVTAVDLLGNGTACLVWSSPLPGDAHQPMRYIDLMGGQKPHLLVKTVNNLGAETVIDYAPSTKFYLADKLAGKPWITRLPFPVHVVERVTVTDKWRKTTFSTTYSYHHGYFDGIEREFRGFGRVEQVDVEDYGKFAAGNTSSPYITADQTLYQPPVKTVTWFHTGAFLDRDRILNQFAHEYFPNWFEDLQPGPQVLGAFHENALPEPDLEALDLSADEWREALRACKGMLLRQEVMELDVDALTTGVHKPVKLFSTAYHNCHIHRIQPRAANKYAIFHVTESEAITYHYELDLRPDTLTPDPRIAHTLNLCSDEYGNIQQAVSVVYPRLSKVVDATLPDGAQALIQQVQSELHLAYSELRYTNDVLEPDNYRLRLPCEVLTYELTGLSPEDAADRASPDPRDNRYFTLDELRAYKLSDKYQSSGTAVEEIAYHLLPNRVAPQKRIVEHGRTLFFATTLDKPLALGQLNALGLPYESYKLALSDEILTLVFKDKLTPSVKTVLADKRTSGYLSGAELTARFGDAAVAGQYWLCAGVAGFNADAVQHFYLPERYTDPFGNVTHLAYDAYDLFITASKDALENTTRVTQFDFRVLAPKEIQDVNDNLTTVYFDILGLVVAVAAKGKGAEGDNLLGFDDGLANPTRAELAAFFTATRFDEAAARRWLGNATARYLYYFGETVDASGQIAWGEHPACACGIGREKHVAQLASGEQSPIQVGFEYSDGMGAVLVKKVQAEPETAGGPLRWIANGKTILNNKGKPVKQYEPYFSPPAVGHCFEEPVALGVTPVIYYDAVGRVIRTEAPDGSFSQVAFSPWHVQSFDQNDTVKASKWYSDRHPLDPDQSLPRNPITGDILATPDQRAAWLAAQHHDTPSLTILDSLGREVIAIAHNRVQKDTGGLVDEKYLTFTKLDAEGKPLWIRDARGNLVMQYIVPPVPNHQATDPASGFVPCYDIAGNLLFQHSMDAGDRWLLNDAAGKPMLAWDFNERLDETGTSLPEQRRFATRHDALHRPLEQWLTINAAMPQLIERFEYIDTKDNPNLAAAKRSNLLGQLHRHYDATGVVVQVRHDFKGNLLEGQRTLASAYQAPVIDWSAGSPTNGLEAETFTQISEYDALNRMTRHYDWHRGVGSRVAVYEPRYNERGLLMGEDLVIRAIKTATGYTEGAGARRTAVIRAIGYDAKGLTENMEVGNGTRTRYDYDPQTFRLRQLRTTRPDYDPRFPDHHAGLRDDKVLQQLNYTYDPVGNITEIVDEAYEPVYFQNQVVEPHSRYTYDALYRLVEATGRENGASVGPPPQRQNSADRVGFPVTDPTALRNYTEQYRYDEVGNIERMQHSAGTVGSWTRHYAYAADSNRLERTWLGSSEVGAIVYRYDTHGNMLNLNNVEEALRTAWDYRDMIQTVNLVGGGRAYYNYDASKERTRKVITNGAGAKQWERFYLGGLEIYRRYSSDRVIEEIETHHVFAGDQRVLIVEDVLKTDRPDPGPGPRFRYQYSNHLDSATVELDESAAVISIEEYHPYGTSAYRIGRNATEVSLKRYRYTGKERDEETGLYYHGARYYAPCLARWTSCDPVGMMDGFNLYIYVRGNPINLSDTTGKQASGYEDEQALVSRPLTGVGGSPKTYSSSYEGSKPTEAEEVAKKSLPDRGASKPTVDLRKGLTKPSLGTQSDCQICDDLNLKLTDFAPELPAPLDAPPEPSDHSGTVIAAIGLSNPITVGPTLFFIFANAVGSDTSALPADIGTATAVISGVGGLAAAPAVRSVVMGTEAEAAEVAAPAVPDVTARAAIPRPVPNVVPNGELGSANGVTYPNLTLQPHGGLLGKLGLKKPVFNPTIDVVSNPVRSTFAGVSAHEGVHASDMLNFPQFSYMGTASKFPGRGISSYLMETRGYYAEFGAKGLLPSYAWRSMTTLERGYLIGEISTAVAGGYATYKANK